MGIDCAIQVKIQTRVQQPESWTGPSHGCGLAIVLIEESEQVCILLLFGRMLTLANSQRLSQFWLWK